MREVVAILGTMALGLAIAAVSVLSMGDRETFVPPPEVVAESFTRAIAAKRFDLATRYLAPGLQRTETAASLAARFERSVRSAGAVNGVDSERRWTDGDRASAGATIDADGGQLALEFALERNQGLWKISVVDWAQR